MSIVKFIPAPLAPSPQPIKRRQNQPLASALPPLPYPSKNPAYPYTFAKFPSNFGKRHAETISRQNRQSDNHAPARKIAPPPLFFQKPDESKTFLSFHVKNLQKKGTKQKLQQ
ncbi:hypothetical protein [Corynebacterium ulcerans]|uniref:hypothetical protein n=1 Tax=Corynebacterium ulcerans TaxID=65058 RepID=UPI00148F3B2B|nr:hypothetical protein [Corynebacterium ulcerans]